MYIVLLFYVSKMFLFPLKSYILLLIKICSIIFSQANLLSQQEREAIILLKRLVRLIEEKEDKSSR